jgi:hypothetical protein
MPMGSMALHQLEHLLEHAERRAVLEVVRSHPEWTLDRIAELLDRGGARALVLGTLTVSELLDHMLAADDGQAGAKIDRRRLARARRLSGPEFDALVREVLLEALGRPVAACYLRARLGGPRWKLQAALGRLVAAGLAQRCGTTSSTRYWISEAARA